MGGFSNGFVMPVLKGIGGLAKNVGQNALSNLDRRFAMTPITKKQKLSDALKQIPGAMKKKPPVPPTAPGNFGSVG